MQVFELHFNPKTKENVVADSFCYEAENVYEKRLGNLYMVGELTNVLPQNVHFLDRLSSTIKKEYYAGFQRPPEAALRESLRKANDFLAGESQKGNVSWLGNLNIAILSVKDFVLNCTKAGNLKILLSREEELLDIGQNLEFQDVEPYPLKIFGNVVVGKLALNDKIMILTKDVFEVFKAENLIAELAVCSDQKSLKEILKTKKEALAKVSGVCLLAILTRKPLPASEPSQPITFRKEKSKRLIKFSPTKIIFAPLKEALKSILTPLKNLRFLTGLRVAFQNATAAFLKNLFKKPLERLVKNRSIILILILILICLLGFYIFREERKAERRQAQMVLDQVQSKVILAESMLILKNEAQANLLFQEAWSKLLPLTKNEAPLKEEALALKKSIEESLVSLNKLENIEEPELASNQKLFEDKENSFSKFRLHYYFLRPQSGEILKCPTPEPSEENCKYWLRENTKKVTQAKSMAVDGSIWILTKDGSIDRYYGGLYKETLELNFWPPLQNPTKIFASKTLPSLYVLEPEKNRMIILTKQGEMVKQYQSEKFDNLLDFAVSEEGKTIYLLNGLKVYQISKGSNF